MQDSNEPVNMEFSFLGIVEASQSVKKDNSIRHHLSKIC